MGETSPLPPPFQYVECWTVPQPLDGDRLTIWSNDISCEKLFSAWLLGRLHPCPGQCQGCSLPPLDLLMGVGSYREGLARLHSQYDSGADPE